MTDYTPEFLACFQDNYGAHYASVPPDLTKCAHKVVRYERGWPRYSQCSRKNGHGPHGAYCGQHDPDAVAKRAEARDAAWRAEREAQRNTAEAARKLEAFREAAVAAIRQIAAGHNDPRQLAADVIAKHEGGEA